MLSTDGVVDVVEGTVLRFGSVSLLSFIDLMRRRALYFGFILSRLLPRYGAGASGNTLGLNRFQVFVISLSF